MLQSGATKKPDLGNICECTPHINFGHFPLHTFHTVKLKLSKVFELLTEIKYPSIKITLRIQFSTKFETLVL